MEPILLLMEACPSSSKRRLTIDARLEGVSKRIYITYIDTILDKFGEERAFICRRGNAYTSHVNGALPIMKGLNFYQDF